MEITIAQTMVTKAFDNDKIGGDSLKPFRRTVKLLKKGENARKQLVSVEQYLKILKHAADHLKIALIIGFNSAMRTGEIRQFKWSYIDKKNNMIRLPKEITKEGKDKSIPINHHIKNLLDNLPRSITGYVITFRGKPLEDKNAFKNALKGACKKAKIPYGRKVKDGITFHDIRRSVKTYMLQSGVDKTYRDAILGHSMKGMDKHYIVSTDEALRAAIDKYTTWLDHEIKLSNLDQNLDQTQKNK